MGAKLGASGPMADINVTPLIDVVLVLLVVFMVVTPMLQSGVDVELPQAERTTEVKDVGQHITISVTESGEVWVEKTQVQLDTLIDRVRFEFDANAERTLLVKADRAVAYGAVREVMDTLSEADPDWSFLRIAATKE